MGCIIETCRSLFFFFFFVFQIQKTPPHLQSARCYVCNGAGHISSECPNKNGRGRNGDAGAGDGQQRGRSRSRERR